jgi:sRNA-binding regulator protein Hfq
MANPVPAPVPDKPNVRSGNSALTADKAPTEQAENTPVSLAPTGPRKLVRPSLPVRALRDKSFSRRNDSPLSAHHEAMVSNNGHPNSHAETFYFQKQAQAQTPMIFILEDGERIEGHIEWYDRNSIKVRNHSRVLIYKSSIKYLYKAQERD